MKFLSAVLALIAFFALFSTAVAAHPNDPLPGTCEYQCSKEFFCLS